MKMKIFTIVCAGVFISLLMASIHSTFLLAGGSDVLDMNVIPSPVSQVVTLVLFLVFSLILVVSGSKLNRRVLLSSFTLLFVFFLFVLINGHTFTISGKKHAMIDKWYHLTLQKLPFNPNGSFESMHYRDTPLGLLWQMENLSYLF